MSRPVRFWYSNFSQGEISDNLEQRADVAKRMNGARTVENCWLLPEGGGFRRPGRTFLRAVRDSADFTRLIPFEYSTSDAYVLEFGHGYIRFIKNRAYIMDPIAPSVPYEIGTSYVPADLRDLHFEQSNDFMFITSLNPALDVHKLARVADDDWVLTEFGADPPPSFEAPEDISNGVATLTPSATSGPAVNFTIAGASEWFGGDIGRRIVSGAGSAVITSITNPFVAVARVIDVFASTAPIPPGGWLLRGSPQVSLDPDIKEPLGATITLIADGDAFRPSAQGKFIKMYGGLIRILAVNSRVNLTGEILSPLSDATTDDPASSPALSWRLEEASWSVARGRPRTLVINGGRLVFFGTPSQPTKMWGSSIDSIFNFAVGSLASDAYEYDLQGGQQNPIQWAASLGSMYVGDTKREYALRGQGVDKPIGGAEAPFVAPIEQVGSAHVQALIVDNAILVIQRFQQDVVQLSYSLNDSPDAGSFVATDTTLFSRQLQDMGFSIHRPAYAKKPYSIAFFPMDNGHLGGLTFKPRQEVSAWSRTKGRTGDDIESVAVVPHENGKKLTIYTITKRTINGLTKRFVEYFEDDDPNLQTRTTDGIKWSGLQTDSAKTGTILEGASTITGITHLPNTVVDVILGDTYIGQKTVSAGGVVTLDASVDANTVYEVGLHYDATLETIRPNIPGEVTEMLKRQWPIVGVRVKNTIGGTINGKALKKQPDGQRMYSGLMKHENIETADPYDGALRLTQDEPYPFMVLGVSGKVSFGEDMV